MQLAARTGAWSGKALPYDAEVEYLESHGTEWIDTGLFANTSEGLNHVDGIEYRFNATRSIGWDFTFGTENRDRSQRFAIWSSEVQGFFFAVRYSPISENVSGFKCGVDHDVSLKNGVVKINGVEKVHGDISFAINGSVWLFGINYLEYGESSENPFAGKIYFANLYWHDDLRMSLLPVLDLAGRPAMYDRVSGQLFYNQGTGEFSYGPIKRGSI